MAESKRSLVIDQAVRNRKDFQEHLAFWTKRAHRKGFPSPESAYRNTAPLWVYKKLCNEAKQILDSTP